MRYILFSIIILFTFSCATQKEKIKFSEAYPSNYNYSLRWKRFDNLKPYLKKDDYKTLEKIKKKYKESTINSYKIILIKKLDKYSYKVILKREEVLLPSNVLKENIYVQYWYYDKDDKNWKIKKEIKDEN